MITSQQHLTISDEEFQSFLNNNEPQLRSYCRRVMGVSCKGDETLDDIFQAACARFWNARSRYREEAEMKTLFFRIVVNLVKDNYKTHQREVNNQSLQDLPQGIPDNSPTSDPWQVFARRARIERIRGAIRELSSDHRIAITLRDIEGYSEKETAEVLGIPVSTVKTRLHRARKQLKGMLEALEIV